MSARREKAMESLRMCLFACGDWMKAEAAHTLMSHASAAELEVVVSWLRMAFRCGYEHHQEMVAGNGKAGVRVW